MTRTGVAAATQTLPTPADLHGIIVLGSRL